MKSTLCLVLLCCLLGAVHSNEIANQWVDKLVDSLNNQTNFDPLTLPRHVTNVSRWFGLLHLEGQFVVHFIKLTGLSHVRRLGDVEVFSDFSSNSTIYKAQLQIGGSDVKAFSSVSAYFGPYIHPEFRTESDIGQIGAHFSVAIGANGKPSLKEFEIDQLQHVRFHVQGPFLPLDPVLEVLGDIFVTIFNTQARHLISIQVQPIVEDELKHFQPNISH